MERHTVFTDWKDLLKQLHTTQGTLQINSILIKIVMVFFTELQLIKQLV